MEDERLTEGPDVTKVDEALINHILSGGLLNSLHKDVHTFNELQGD